MIYQGSTNHKPDPDATDCSDHSQKAPDEGKVVEAPAMVPKRDADQVSERGFRCQYAGSGQWFFQKGETQWALFDEPIRKPPSYAPPVAAPGDGEMDLADAEVKIQAASTELSRLCKDIWAGKKPWHWEIPANPARDSDLLLGAAIEVAIKAVAEIRRLRNPITPAPTAEKAPEVPLAIGILPHPGKPGRFICYGCSVDVFPPGYRCPTPGCKMTREPEAPDSSHTPQPSKGEPAFTIQPWEDGDAILCFHGRPVGETLTDRDAARIYQWLKSAWREILQSKGPSPQKGSEA